MMKPIEIVFRDVPEVPESHIFTKLNEEGLLSSNHVNQIWHTTSDSLLSKKREIYSKLKAMTTEELFEYCLENEEASLFAIKNKFIGPKLGFYDTNKLNSQQTFWVCENSFDGNGNSNYMRKIDGGYLVKLSEKWPSVKEVILEKYPELLSKQQSAELAGKNDYMDYGYF